MNRWGGSCRGRANPECPPLQLRVAAGVNESSPQHHTHASGVGNHPQPRQSQGSPRGCGTGTRGPRRGAGHGGSQCPPGTSPAALATQEVAAGAAGAVSKLRWAPGEPTRAGLSPALLPAQRRAALLACRRHAGLRFVSSAGKAKGIILGEACEIRSGRSSAELSSARKALTFAKGPRNKASGSQRAEPAVTRGAALCLGPGAGGGQRYPNPGGQTATGQGSAGMPLESLGIEMLLWHTEILVEMGA